jgi:hypothetical protein
MPPGWQPVPGRPFDGHFEEVVHEVARILHGVPRGAGSDRMVGTTSFSDAFRTSIDGRAVTVANAWTGIEPGLFPGRQGPPGTAVCVVEITAVLPILSIQPRRFRGPAPHGETRSGNPVFDQNYQVTGLPATMTQRTGLSGAQDVLTPEVQQRIMARDDWIFRAERYLFGCVSLGAFGSADQFGARIGEVLGIVSAIPGSVMPGRVDHSADDIAARISQINSVEDAIAFLQGLTPPEREQLARSATPLAAFADVQTPDQAMARFETLDPQARMQLMAMFMRVGDQ